LAGNHENDFSPPLALSFLLARASSLPESISRDISQFLKSAEFRRADELIDQILFFREDAHKFPWQILSILFNNPTSTIRDWMKGGCHEKRSNPDHASGHDWLPGPNSALTFFEEDTVFQWIRDHQIQRDCVTPRQVRDFAADLRHQRIKDDKICTKHWWRSFKQQNAARLETVHLASLDSARCEVTLEEVRHFFSDVAQALSEIRSLAQLLNMDETGFCSRPTKGRKKTVVYTSQCSVSPFQFRSHQGYAFAQYNYEICLQNVECASLDLKGAAHSYKFAADQGDIFAQFNYWNCLRDRKDVSKN
jgi:hypothetical protein